MTERLPADPAVILRRGLIVLAALGVAGTTLELVFLRHWDGTEAFVWPSLVMAAAAIVGLVVAPTRSRVLVVRWLSVGVLIVGLAGVAIHVNANLEAAPLDRDYADSWAGIPWPEQWWLAVTGSVGPAPTLAPGALVEIAGATFLATLGIGLAAAADARRPGAS